MKTLTLRQQITTLVQRYNYATTALGDDEDEAFNTLITDILAAVVESLPKKKDEKSAATVEAEWWIIGRNQVIEEIKERLSK